MAKKRLTIGFDADDTLWQNETFFQMTQARFAELLAEFADSETLAERLLQAERRNIGHYGFGIKGFMLSMIETAIEVTQARVDGAVIAEILAAGQEMLRHPIHLLPHVRTTVEAFAATHKLVLITKGDLLDQERKLAQSGLGELFDAVEIVSHKTPEIYESAFTRHGAGPSQAVMIGNSVSSDILPALEAGAHAIFVPHSLEWALEHSEKPVAHPRYHEIDDLSGLAPVIAAIEAGL